MNISDAGIATLREREGCKLEAYQDSVGCWTIGVGHTAAAGEPIPCAGMTITQDEADDLLDEDLDAYEDCVNEVVAEPMTQSQYDAFVSICFNIGQTAFAQASFVASFNHGDSDGCASAILWWNKPPEIIPRRQGEYVQFLGGYVARVKELGS
jgi:lysozyme